MTVPLDKPPSLKSSTGHTSLVQEYFDNHAQSWHDYYQAGKSLTHLILKDRMRIGLEFLSRYMQPGQDIKVLDAGCGSGLIGVEMARMGYWVHGWDISENMVTLSQKNYKEAQISADQYKLSLGNVLESNLVPASFDAIMALGFLQYQPDEEQVLRYFHQLLKPDGILVLSGPVGVKLSNYFGLAGKIKTLRRRRRKTAAQRKVKSTQAADRKHLHTISANNYSLKRFQDLFQSTGFQTLDFRGHGYAHFEFLRRRLPNRHQKRIHLLLSKASKIIPIQRYANDMVVVARR